MLHARRRIACRTGGARAFGRIDAAAARRLVGRWRRAARRRGGETRARSSSGVAPAPWRGAPSSCARRRGRRWRGFAMRRRRALVGAAPRCAGPAAACAYLGAPAREGADGRGPARRAAVDAHVAPDRRGLRRLRRLRRPPRTTAVAAAASRRRLVHLLGRLARGDAERRPGRVCATSTPADGPAVRPPRRRRRRLDRRGGGGARASRARRRRLDRRARQHGGAAGGAARRPAAARRAARRARGTAGGARAHSPSRA